MTRVFYASTLFGVLTLAAALDAGCFGDRAERRLLLVANNTAIPEISDRLDTASAFEPLRHRFDEVVSWNELIAPLHPSGWVPPAAEVPLLSRLIKRELGLDDVRELAIESPAVAPARTIATLIPDCPVTVYSDGLMSYGPTRDTIAESIGRRAARLLHLDLVPELTPLLLREIGIAPEPIPDSAFAKVLAELPEPDVVGAYGAPVIVGQYLSALKVLSQAEEDRVYADLLGGLRAAGHRHVVFRPHPAAGRAQVASLRAAADLGGVQLTVPDDALPVEAWCAAAQPDLIVGCFSTALFTASRFVGVPAATMGTEEVLEAISPYENSNRIPATLADAVLPRLGADGTVTPPPALPVGELVRSVGYCMQAERNPDLRPAAASYLARYGAKRYFKNLRLQRLGLAPSSRATEMRATGRRVAVRTRAALPPRMRAVVTAALRSR